LSSTEQHARELWGGVDIGRWLASRGADFRPRGHEVEDRLRALRTLGVERAVWRLEGTEEAQKRLKGRCPVKAAVRFARRQRMSLCGALAATDVEGRLRGAAAEPDRLCCGRDGRPDPRRASLFRPEVRRERIDSLVEAAWLGMDGVCVDFCRRPPAMGYDPDLVREYTLTGGPEAAELSLTDPAFVDWCRFRAGFVTAMLRDLREALAGIEQAQGRRILLVARVPADGPELNLACGMDTETWCRRGLVDVLWPHPLRWLALDQEQTIEPYAQRARECGVALIGGVCLEPPQGVEKNPVALARRVLRQYEEGAGGMVVEEIEQGAADGDLRWVVSALAEPERLARLAADEQRQRQYPLTQAGAWFGVDRESCVPGSGRQGFAPTDL